MLMSFSQIPKQLLYEFETKQSWLRHDSRLHGVGHMMRVFILQELICDQLEGQGVAVDRQATRWAASVHDVGRVDDGVDYEHGWRSAEWMKENLPPAMTPETVDTATELKVLKDADGLDRVRLGDLDESYLRTEAAKTLVETARQLYELSQPSSPDERDSFATVLDAATELGLVSK